MIIITYRTTMDCARIFTPWRFKEISDSEGTQGNMKYQIMTL
jgi:hypothetical protein